MNRVAVINTGVGNLASIRAALERLGAEPSLAGSPADLADATHMVLPGVGSYAAGVERLQAGGFGPAVCDWIAADRPFLAVCLGLQLLAEGSDEAPDVAGLGVLEGRIERLPADRVPHLGWNGVRADEAAGGVLSSGDAAFANSYALLHAPPGWQVAWTEHGTRFVAAVERGRALACQFHPELSGVWGETLLRRWLDGTDANGASTGVARSAVARILPCLDVRDGRIVKGVKFQNLRDAGDPAERAALYERQGADEIVMLDVGASPEGRDHQLETVRAVRRRLGIALTVGGGVRREEDARDLLAAGADKVGVNTAAVKDPELIDRLADRFGRQCIVLAVDARRGEEGWDVLTHGGRKSTGRDALDWMREAARRGAGEILLTSWDRDGTQEGADLELLRAARRAVAIPVVSSGGIGLPRHALEAFLAGADAVLAASIFHDATFEVGDLKSFLAGCGIEVRT